ncbi:Catalase [Klebsormidium nitens]|uniref:Catalase n=1 Tax=Klebsormidium nitens TaxID=105231 RepID=A0A1Y1HMZ2_KLENI|nr:Catalase [Klebsormidium nitens]|eukprot:GAQ78361.1 Catalase [Klebsormidium nitens]
MLGAWKAGRPNWGSGVPGRKAVGALAALVGLLLVASIVHRLLALPVTYHSAPGDSLRVLSFNVYQGYNRAGGNNFRAIQNVIRDQKPHFVMLQETDTMRIIQGNRDMVDYLSLGLRMYALATPPTRKNTWGCAMLSRFPFKSATWEVLPSENGEAACFQHATVQVGTQTLHLMNTHFGEDDRDRTAQARAVAEHIREALQTGGKADERLSGQEQPVTNVSDTSSSARVSIVLAGDFNSAPLSPQYMEIVSAGISDARVELYGQWKNPAERDRGAGLVFVSRALNCTKWVEPTYDQQKTADGNPVVVTFTRLLEQSSNFVKDKMTASNGDANGSAEVKTTSSGAAANQQKMGSDGKTPLYTSGGGHPIQDDNNSFTVGDGGLILMEDFTLIEKLAHFNRERIPERVVHASGQGGHGYFEVTKDVTHLCKANFLSEVGKRTPILARFSTVGFESGGADTVRDPRGFSVKFYTEEGNWDMVGNNTPVFFIRDPSKFPDLIHTQKRHPAKHTKDPDMFWDFLSLVPESFHQVLILFSPRGVPVSPRYMNGYGSHTFKWVNKEGQFNWVKFHFKTNQGIKNWTHQEAVKVAGESPDSAKEDLYEAIARGEHPSWTFYVQVMSPEQAETFKWDPFDLTKTWPHKEYPLQEVGRLVLDRNVTNYFNEVEQAAFSPSHMPPGIQASPDRVLQARLFSYDDAARYRLGSNFLLIPVNKPRHKAQNYHVDGLMQCGDNGGSGPNYYPNSRELYPNAPRPDPAVKYPEPFQVPAGLAGRYINKKWADQDDWDQPRALWEKFSDEDKEQTLSNIVGMLAPCQQFLQDRVVGLFGKIHEDMAAGLTKRLNAAKEGKAKTSQTA